MRKMSLVVLLAMSLLAGVFVTSCQGPADKSPAASQSSATKPQAINPAVAPTKSVTVDTGFVFIDGRYIEAPYKLELIGGDLVINGIFANNLSALPRVPESDPEVPAWITEKTRPGELQGCECGIPDILGRKWLYLTKHYSPNEVIERLTKYINELSCVASARASEVGMDNSYVIFDIRYKSGDNYSTIFFEEESTTVSRRIRSGWSKEAKAEMDDTIEHYLASRKRNRAELRAQSKNYYQAILGWLKENSAEFFSKEYSSHHKDQDWVAVNLPAITLVLNSKMVQAEKRFLIAKISPELDDLSFNFVPSKQLDERLAAMVKKLGVKPITLEELRAMPDPFQSETKPTGAR